MSSDNLDVLSLIIDETGRVVLTDSNLIAIADHLKLPAGGQEFETTRNFIFCDREYTNTLNCRDQANISCDNDWMCQGSSNLTECTNQVNCSGQGGQNLLTCTNQTTSGCSP